MNHAGELYRLYRKFHFFYLILLLLSFSLSSTAQSLDSSSYPVLWLRTDKSLFTDSSWNDVTGNGYYGLIFGQGQKKRTLLNYNPALTFNGIDDSIRILYNLDSLNELTIMAVFQPADTTEAGVWGTGNALARSTLMTTHQVFGPDSTIDRITPAQQSTKGK